MAKLKWKTVTKPEVISRLTAVVAFGFAPYWRRTLMM